MGQVSDRHAGSGDPEVAPVPRWMTAVRKVVENNLAVPDDAPATEPDDEHGAVDEPADDGLLVRASDVKRLRAKRAGRRTPPRDPSTPTVSRPLRLDR